MRYLNSLRHLYIVSMRIIIFTARRLEWFVKFVIAKADISHLDYGETFRYVTLLQRQVKGPHSPNNYIRFVL